MKKQSALLLTLLSLAFAAPAFADAQMDAMAQFDKDKNGYVTKEEAMKAGMSAEKFDKMDMNKDGKIDKDEWKKTYTPG
jgi:Ca2+-binding EF-hand superfamily protein